MLGYLRWLLLFRPHILLFLTRDTHVVREKTQQQQHHHHHLIITTDHHIIHITPTTIPEGLHRTPTNTSSLTYSDSLTFESYKPSPKKESTNADRHKNTYILNMGSSSSKTESPPFCEDCQPDKQMSLPPKDNISKQGGPCGPFYEFVESCMKINDGQISMCKEEWEAFKKCHEDNKAPPK